MVGAGSKDFGRDGRKENGGWERGASGLRERGWRDVGVMIERGGQEETEVREEEMAKREGRITETQPAIKLRDEEEQAKVQEKRMFSGLTIYLNGSTAPMISDHKLKHLLAEHGARISIRLGRRSVTHVILGKPNGHHGGAGGGLAGSKIQKEIQRVGGKGVKFVGVEWVLESIEAGKRLPEARFAVGEIKPKGVKSVYGMFLKKKEATARTDPEKEGV